MPPFPFDVLAPSEHLDVVTLGSHHLGKRFGWYIEDAVMTHYPFKISHENQFAAY